MKITFPYYKQLDAMNCGPTALRMVAKHYGKTYSLQYLRNIKNCPSMKESFGNIKDTTLEEALNKHGFKKYWNIKKDDVTKCKDCEFRYICTDCRAYIADPSDIFHPQ